MATKTNGRNGKRKGRRNPVEFVKHPDTDLEIDGLRYHKSTGTFYRIADDGKSRDYYRKNGLKGIAYLRRAIYEHECWQNGNAPTDTIPIPATAPAYDDFGAEIPPVATLDENGRQDLIRYISKDDLAAYIRDQLSNPETRSEFANAVGIPELVNLHSLPPVAAPLPMQDIINNYAKGKTFKHNRQLADAKSAWKLFADSVNVPNLDDIDPTHLQRFHKAVRAAGKPRTQKNIVLSVQSILKYAADIFRNHRPLIEDVKLEIRRICSWETQTQPNPKPMKKDAYHGLLQLCQDEGDVMWFAILITSLNLGLHPSEMAELKTDEFDFDELTFTSNRTKTGVSRVATIWQRTADAIRAYMETDHFKANASPLLFTTTQPNRQGKVNQPLKIERITAKIRRLRKSAELGNNVVFDGIRDLFRTSAGVANIVAIKWTMGQSMGEDDKYGFRDPKETADVMAKVERVVFDKLKRKRGKK